LKLPCRASRFLVSLAPHADEGVPRGGSRCPCPV